MTDIASIVAERLDKLIKDIEEVGILKVGINESATYPDGLEVAKVAFWNEIGTVHAPPRPFLRNTFANKNKDWSEMAKRIFVGTDYDLARTWGMLGEAVVGDLKDAITTFSDPMNAPSTVEKKGFNTPLVDTGVMRDSIIYDISPEDSE